LSSNDSREKGYRLALAQAAESLKGLDWKACAARCGGRLSDDGSAMVVTFFGTDYLVSPDGEVCGGEGDVPAFTRLIILHYLARSTGAAATGHIVTFREVPDGGFYFHSFQDRVLKPLRDTFGDRPDLLRKRGTAAGWKPIDEGDVCQETNALPLVPIRVILWCGDEELTPEVSVLFDSGVSNHLHTEDIALVAEEAVGTLTRERRDG